MSQPAPTSAPIPLESAPCLSCGASEGEPAATTPVQMAPIDGAFTFRSCRSCGLIYLSPRVPANAISPYYDPTYLPHRGAQAWGRFAHLVEGSQRAQDRQRARLVQAASGLGASGRALDLGCGSPTYLAQLKELTSARCVGVDFTDEGWRGKAGLEGLELKAGTLFEVDLEPGFDALSMWHALEHEYEPLAVLRRLRELASPGATLVVEVPNYDSLTRRLQGPHWAGYHTPRHTAAYTPQSLHQLLERGGWRVEKVQTWGTFDPFVLWWLGREEAQGRSLRGDMEPRFVPFVALKVLSMPLFWLQRFLSLGVMLALAKAPE